MGPKARGARFTVAAAALGLLGCASHGAQGAPQASGSVASGSASAADAGPASPLAPSGIARFRREAIALAPLVHTGLGRSFLGSVDALTPVAPRVVYHDPDKSHWYTEDEARALPRAVQSGLVAQPVDEAFYFATGYDTPLSYARALDVLAGAGFDGMEHTRVLDFGYGMIGQLRMLASLGADVTGFDPAPLLRALYAPADEGPVGAHGGRVRLSHERFLSDLSVGDGPFDLVLSKNTLKHGYVHPEHPVPERLTIDLGADDDGFLRLLRARTRAGGWVLVYNICPAPAPSGKPYIPWADGHSPFTRETWERAGFRVLAFDLDDTPATREMARALGWDKGDDAMDIDHDLFALYTLVRAAP